MEDSAGGALGAARELAVRLRAEVPMLDAGIGVSAGPVVAGYIGAEERFEYTVIGDPVNEAARLSDLAKGRTRGCSPRPPSSTSRIWPSRTSGTSAAR
ncbi:adenylate/guanylate cyclase domain-containing protein [Actinomadura madurae]|nr:adenylate/guanylate cyclase domain-containing protein [Actinomadura madurae]